MNQMGKIDSFWKIKMKYFSGVDSGIQPGGPMVSTLCEPIMEVWEQSLVKDFSVVLNLVQVSNSGT